MNQLDLIIDALENSEPTGTGWVHVYEQKHQAALAAARELKNLTPAAWLYDGKLHFFDPTDWASSLVQPLFALEALK